MKERVKIFIALLAVLGIAGFFRWYNLNWDSGHHLHPDERAIIMKVTDLTIPLSLPDFFTPESPLNPKFFAYGSLPFYLLFLVSSIASHFELALGEYEKIHIVGRILSALFDMLTIVVLFQLSRKFLGTKGGILAAAIYALSVLPIQLSHFYAVDTLLTFFVTLTLLQLIKFYEKQTLIRSIVIGICFGLALATKVSASVLIISIGTALSIDFFFIFLKQPHKIHHWLSHTPAFVNKLAKYGIAITLTTIITFFVAEPYALIDFKEFLRQTTEQSQLTRNAFSFPYTLQYVGKTPYLFELKNIFLWGLGPVITILAIVGGVIFTKHAFSKEKKEKWAVEIVLLSFFVGYFLVVGKFAVGFMRYMLPLYPILALFAAVALYRLLRILKDRTHSIYTYLCILLFALCLVIWPISFLHIYQNTHSRETASEWINTMIPAGSTLAVEHWDDNLPFSGQEKYTLETLALYEPDSQAKWSTIEDQLKRTDYIVISSNRLYAPLMRLTNCQTLPADRCYTKTAQYYKDLFAGRRGFRKIAEFHITPAIPIINKSIDDLSADESFTVYDHPKVMIFKKL